MIIIRNNIIPFKGFAAINLFGVLFARKGVYLSPSLINHEQIHTAQMKELLYVPFYLIYVLEWLWNLILCGDSYTAYRGISFEKEAYKHEYHAWYLFARPPFSQWKHNDA